MEISKELFEAVYGKSLKELSLDSSDLKNIDFNAFFFKCKVWAVANNRELYSSSSGHCYISNLNRNNPSNTIDHYAETEVEATIKAYEYILKEINGNK